MISDDVFPGAAGRAEVEMAFQRSTDPFSDPMRSSVESTGCWREAETDDAPCVLASL